MIGLNVKWCKRMTAHTLYDKYYFKWADSNRIEYRLYWAIHSRTRIFHSKNTNTLNVMLVLKHKKNVWDRKSSEFCANNGPQQCIERAAKSGKFRPIQKEISIWKKKCREWIISFRRDSVLVVLWNSNTKVESDFCRRDSVSVVCIEAQERCKSELFYDKIVWNCKIGRKRRNVEGTMWFFLEKDSASVCVSRIGNRSEWAPVRTSFIAHFSVRGS